MVRSPRWIINPSWTVQVDDGHYINSKMVNLDVIQGFITYLLPYQCYIVCYHLYDNGSRYLMP